MSCLNFRSFKRALILSEKNKKSKTCQSYAVYMLIKTALPFPAQFQPDWLSKFDKKGAFCNKKCN